MKTVYDEERDSMDTILMRVYGLSEMQCGLFNSEYKHQLYNNFITILEDNYQKQNGKIKKLSLFKRK